MKVKNLLSEDDAVSPVIGVILMVAITVILAAVIGTFVLGLGDQVSSTSPQASFSFEQGTFDPAGDGDGNAWPSVTVTHDGGDAIDNANLNVLVNGEQAYTDDGTNVQGLWSNEVSAGAGVTIVSATDDSSVTTGTSVHAEDDTNSQLDIEDGSGTVQVDGAELASDETVRVVWSSSDGSSTATLGSYTIS